MSKIDKNEQLIKYLLQCQVVQDNSLFFNFADAKDNNNQLVSNANDIILNKPFIDGSILKLFTITLLIYKSISYNAVVKETGYPDENIMDFAEAQELIDWINEQNDNRNFPDFGENCIVEEINVTTDNPYLEGVNDELNPPLAQYSITIQIQYLDTTKVVWDS